MSKENLASDGRSIGWHLSECRRVINESLDRKQALKLNRETRREYAENLKADETAFSHLAAIQAKLNCLNHGG